MQIPITISQSRGGRQERSPRAYQGRSGSVRGTPRRVSRRSRSSARAQVPGRYIGTRTTRGAAIRSAAFRGRRR